jgi:hypothetical protein
VAAGRDPRHPETVALIQQAVDAANERLARVEQIKRLRILEGDWLAGGEELTPTMKLKRRPIAESTPPRSRSYTRHDRGHRNRCRSGARDRLFPAAQRTHGERDRLPGPHPALRRGGGAPGDARALGSCEAAAGSRSPAGGAGTGGGRDRGVRVRRRARWPPGSSRWSSDAATAASGLCSTSRPDWPCARSRRSAPRSRSSAGYHGWRGWMSRICRP